MNEEMRSKTSFDAAGEATGTTTLLASTPADAVVIVDELGSVLHWNEAAAAMFGYRELEVVGLDLGELIAPAADRGLASFHDTTSASGGVVNRPVVLQAARRGRRTFLVAVLVADLGFCGLAGTVIRIREIERHGLFHPGPLPVAVVQPHDAQLVACDDALAILLGMPREELVGLPLSALFPPGTPSPMTLAAASIELTHPSGLCGHSEITVDRLAFAPQTPVLLTFHDITRRLQVRRYRVVSQALRQQGRNVRLLMSELDAVYARVAELATAVTSANDMDEARRLATATLEMAQRYQQLSSQLVRIDSIDEEAFAERPEALGHSSGWGSSRVEPGASTRVLLESPQTAFFRRPTTGAGRPPQD